MLYFVVGNIHLTAPVLESKITQEHFNGIMEYTKPVCCFGFFPWDVSCFANLELLHLIYNYTNWGKKQWEYMKAEKYRF